MMNRRSFVKMGAFAGLLLELGMENNELVFATNKPNVIADVDFDEATILQLQAQLSKGEISSRLLTSFYLKRIIEIDENGVKLNAIIELNPDAIRIATKLDAERKAGKIRSLLHGIPILIKDNIDTADHMKTTAGSLALEGNIAVKDAFIVEKLRNAGAVILGKTNLSEWAGFRAMLNSSDGWSSRGGQTKNPYILDRSPAGSSAGSAVAVAANLCCVAVGTETSGSIIAPSSCSGIVGLKPTVGLISRSGIIPISASLDTPGPMGRTVTDVAILLSVLVGADIADEATQNLVKGEAIAYDKFLDRASLKGKRIGFEKPSFLAPEIETLYKKAIDDFRALGAEMVEVDLRNQLMMGVMTTLPLLFTEFKDGINKYLSKSKGKVKSLEELIAFNKANEAKVMPYFKQDLLEASQKAPAISEDAYQKVLKSAKEFKNKVAQTIKALDVDAVISSSATGLTPCIDHSKGSTGGAGFLFAGLAAAAGLPHITLPMGSYKELPQGLSIVSGFFEEAKLLSIAFAYEQATKHRAAPKFIESNKDLPCN